VGPPADIYALGVLIYRLLAGRAPFVGDTVYVLHAHAYEPPPPLAGFRPDLPRSVYAAIEAALAKDPTERPPSAAVAPPVVEAPVSPLAPPELEVPAVREEAIPPTEVVERAPAGSRVEA